MTIDNVITGVILLVCSAVILFVGKIIYDVLHRKFRLREELLKKDNFALGYAVSGYYLGLILAVGGILTGPEGYWLDEVFDVVYFGLISVVLLNLSAFLQDKIIFRTFSMQKEIIEDENPGAGIIEGAHHIANGLILYGAMSGEGDLLTALIFWAIGQVVLVIAGTIYNVITPFDIHKEIERDNVAVSVAVAGVLVAIGNIIRFAIEGSFESWQANLSELGITLVYGFILLPVIRFFVDHLLLPGEKITDELVHQERPNVGAAAIEAIAYVGASFLIGWAA
ncbi:MAG: DUF350 domain-containing protein [Candidatus Aminicenantes bacterium]|nr:DUF350 domain-containing protein [Candidatus Aminicenantes bacterium]NIM83625.1 DUF350 domain-containing protein [Candidatus Aminicenantes bacterium]NIN23028.1 DUF350 domain-containing protein [Candidatus Aminicenantes bacterium]NIN46764.1 DUF350 domain-containing protein [Candidatus Aminicenantes bacterium]NIN89677.1 DUF350 domain-containing protein [Candidatus Aminicenantes bacterium]